MGACMAPAAADLIVANFKDFETDEKYYDRIITGDLGTVGREILINLVKEKVMIFRRFIWTAELKYLTRKNREHMLAEVDAAAVRWCLAHI